ncbi:hypothetical protein B5F12_04020 [Pseudoflavonifractor sp. An176]|uniref:hypothetical protein n=1 Tax=Pseudoflavonifractor sp. An176 TaxID=1965572 RepID=UPI000B392E2B|nr:hypothetical protein [Pseudoflavonifractor sp. An176]OUP65171.1 hypothetical protein B5F12_04020 [Pseudoflavonifractor sp. An176]
MEKKVETYNGRAVVYKEDVAEALGCCDNTALIMMKRTGCAVKVGRRVALYVGDFYSLLLGIDRDRREKGIEVR